MNTAVLDIDCATGSSTLVVSELPVLLRRCLDGCTAATGVLAAADAGTTQEPATDAVDAADGSDIQASLGGDGDAYARLVRRYQQPIAAYMWRFTRNRCDWEELVHDVFVEAYLSLAGYQARSPLLHWLRRIATRVGYRYWKDRQRQRAHTAPLGDQSLATLASPDRSESAQQAGELVHALLSRLAPRDRMVMTLMYLESCTVAEIAERTGWSRSLVKVQAHRARKRLRKIFEMVKEEP
jgi:RNA polymerase sigma-70 factor (ECF subfamily)